MGTRSITTIYEGDTPLVMLYRQYDGYPDGHGAQMANFLKGKKVVNGISGDGSAIFNGAGDLAVRLITALKEDPDSAGNLYIEGYSDKPDSFWGVDYVYEVRVPSVVDNPSANYSVQIIVRSGFRDGEVLIDCDVNDYDTALALIES